MDTARIIGKTFCDVLLSELTTSTKSNDNTDKHEKSSSSPLMDVFQKQIQVTEQLKSMSAEKRLKVLEQNNDNNPIQAIKIQTLLKIDSLQNAVFDSSLQTTTTPTVKCEGDTTAKTVKTKDGQTAQRISEIVSDSRSGCQIHRLPRPGTEAFFLSFQNPSQLLLSRASGQRRQRNDEDENENNDENEEVEREQPINLENIFFNNNSNRNNNNKNQQQQHPPVIVDGITFSALTTCVARSLMANEKFKTFLMETQNCRLDSSSSSSAPDDTTTTTSQSQNSGTSGGDASYRLVHMIVTLLLNLFRRIQCYSQCQIDLQSKLVAAAAEDDDGNDEQKEEAINNPQHKRAIAPESHSVSLVRKALNNCENKHQKANGERFLNVSVTNPIKSQRTFFNPEFEERIISMESGVLATKNKPQQQQCGSKTTKQNRKELKLVGNLNVSRVVVQAAIDSLL